MKFTRSLADDKRIGLIQPKLQIVKLIVLKTHNNSIEIPDTCDWFVECRLVWSNDTLLKWDGEFAVIIRQSQSLSLNGVLYVLI